MHCYLENMKMINKHTICFESLLKFSELVHGYSLREGGVSKECYQSLNLGFHNGDDPNKVSQNYKIWAHSLGVKTEQIVLSAQSHTDHIRIVSKKDAAKGILLPQDYQDIDGLVTNEINLAICTLHADCLPVYFYDNIQKVIGLVHSGWRGTYAQIYLKMIDIMETHFGCSKKNIHIGIGPGISKKAYEIDSQLASEFKNRFSNWSDFLEENIKGNYQLSLATCIYEDLIQEGILKENIEVSKVCTATYSDLVFSHRASGGRRGNSAAILMMK